MVKILLNMKICSMVFKKTQNKLQFLKKKYYKIQSPTYIVTQFLQVKLFSKEFTKQSAWFPTIGMHSNDLRLF